MIKYCTNCGSKCNEDAKFCKKCGCQFSNCQTQSRDMNITKDNVQKSQSRIKLSIIIPIAIVIIALCSFGLYFFVFKENTSDLTLQNKVQNLSRGGDVVEYENGIIAFFSEEKSIVKIDKNGESTTLVSDLNGVNIRLNVEKNTLYYLSWIDESENNNGFSGNEVFKYDLDTGEKTRITHLADRYCYAMNLFVYQDKMYFSKRAETISNEEYSICITDLEGNTINEIITNDNYQFLACESGFYYILASELSLYKADLSGNNPEKIYRFNTKDQFNDGMYLYGEDLLIRSINSNAVSFMMINSKGKVLRDDLTFNISHSGATIPLIIVGDTIYYMQKYGDSNLYSVKLDDDSENKSYILGDNIVTPGLYVEGDYLLMLGKDDKKKNGFSKLFKLIDSSFVQIY